jgi:peptidoglycan hydrolase-like protein with peptidoglycan-binding domain
MSDWIELLKQEAKRRGYTLGGMNSPASELMELIGRVGTGATPTTPATNTGQSSTTTTQNQTPAQPVAQTNSVQGIQNLRLGDYDNKSNKYRYDGTEAPRANGQTYNQVETLQTNLRSIGLDEIVGTADGDYGSRSAIAVAIFQGFAQVKTRDDTNANTPNPMNYTGGVTGNADGLTRQTLQRYVNENIVLPVQNLKQVLTDCGLGDLVGTIDNNYNWATYLSVREFQIYAKMGRVAQRPASPNSSGPLSDSLTTAENTEPYTGPVSGVVDLTTDSQMSRWSTNLYHIQLITEAWTMSNGTRTSLQSQNFIRHDAMTNVSPRVWMRDFTGHYTLPTARQNDTHTVVGGYSAYAGWGGPVSLPRYDHTWSPESEFLPDHCTGKTWATMTAAEKSTYRTIRSICERESLGYFDCMNAYDRAVVSAGPYHWTICILESASPNKPGNGELVPLLARLRVNHPTEYQTYFEYFGVRPSDDWGTKGDDFFDTSKHKYSGWLSFQLTATDYVDIPRIRELGDYFRTWHWFYRVQMMCRLSSDVQEEMWTYARMRVRDIQATEWDGTATVSDGNGGTRNALIGDYFTSEKALAMITRWHVWSPGGMVSGGNAGSWLKQVLTAANLTGDPSTWTDANEATLITKLREKGRAKATGLGDGLDDINTWPTSMPSSWNLTLNTATVGTFSADRNSFDLDTTGLPTQAF